MIQLTYQPTELSIAKEVMPAKREMKKYPQKVNTKQTGAEIQALNVDNFSNLTEKC